jgi:tRNA/rRNA methyltransferase/tRNA (cytidine32/uridine32-2'-O)-methyltransferase
MRGRIYISVPMKPPRLVLLRPRNADNLGAIARAMKNFGLSDWVVVSPNPKLLEVPGLNRLAVKSGELLETVRRVDTFAEAIADCTWVVGTTMRLIDGHRRLTPRELAEQAHARADETWALVFGDERNGLLADDVRQCHALSFIPSSDEQPSLNLAQAVVVYGYELAMARRGTVSAPPPALADDATLRQVRTSMELGLHAAGFLRTDTDDRHAVDDLMASLTRGRLTKKEAGLWTAAFRVISKRSTRDGATDGAP